MTNPQTNFKDQMAEVRRTQILLGAAQVFAAKGFHKATTKQIAKAAGVSEGTIYNYFDNKRDLLLAMVEMLATQTFKHIGFDHPPDDPGEFFKQVLMDRYRLIEEHGHIIAPLVAEIFADVSLREAIYSQVLKPMTGLVEQYIQHQIEAGTFKPVNPVVATRAFIGTMIINTSLKFSGLDSRYEAISAETLIDEVVSLFLDGLLRRA